MAKIKKQVILASASPRRKELLKRIIKKFRVVKSGVDELKIKASLPVVFARKAALFKALAVACRYKKSIIIGADTVVSVGKKILGKPKDKKEAVNMLMKLSGKVNKVTTGLAIVFPEYKTVSDVVTTQVKMKQFTRKEAERYVNDFLPLDKAGAYGIQEMDEVFIASIVGDYDNVVGLPVKRLSDILSKS